MRNAQNDFSKRVMKNMSKATGWYVTVRKFNGKRDDNNEVIPPTDKYYVERFFNSKGYYVVTLIAGGDQVKAEEKVSRYHPSRGNTSRGNMDTYQFSLSLSLTNLFHHSKLLQKDCTFTHETFNEILVRAPQDMPKLTFEHALWLRKEFAAVANYDIRTTAVNDSAISDLTDNSTSNGGENNKAEKQPMTNPSPEEPSLVAYCTQGPSAGGYPVLQDVGMASKITVSTKDHGGAVGIEQHGEMNEPPPGVVQGAPSCQGAAGMEQNGVNKELPSGIETAGEMDAAQFKRTDVAGVSHATQPPVIPHHQEHRV